MNLVEINFLKSIKQGDIKKVKKILVSREFDLDFFIPEKDDYDENEQPLWDDEDEYGFTPLILACSSGKLEVVKLLVAAGANIEQGRYGSDDDLKPIHFAASLEILEYLLDQGADINATDMMGNTLISMKISEDNDTWTSFLIDRGVNLTIEVDTGWGSGGDAVQNLIYKKNSFILKKIFDSGFDLKPYLVDLATQGYTEYVAEIMAQQKLKINEALFRAAESGQAQIVEMLIRNGADINTKACKLEDMEASYWVDDYKVTEMTPLEVAKEKGHTEVINILTAARAKD